MKPGTSVEVRKCKACGRLFEVDRRLRRNKCFECVKPANPNAAVVRTTGAKSDWVYAVEAYSESRLNSWWRRGHKALDDFPPGCHPARWRMFVCNKRRHQDFGPHAAMYDLALPPDLLG